MSIKITIGKKESPEGEIKITLNARKSLDGNIMIFDHEDIDIVVMPTDMKIITFGKDILDDKIYDTQNRFFKFLCLKGIIDRESVKSGNIYGSLEGQILESQNDINEPDLALLNISRWLDEERPIFMYEKAIEEKEKERLLEPGIKDSTELGEIPSDREKEYNKNKSIPHSFTKRMYGY